MNIWDILILLIIGGAVTLALRTRRVLLRVRRMREGMPGAAAGQERDKLLKI